MATPMNNLSALEVFEEMQRRHPDRMLIDNFDDFERGKQVGYILAIEEIERMLFDDNNKDNEEVTYEY